MSDDDFDGIIDGTAAIALGVYLVVVFANGNINKLFSELQKESGFIEFLIAAFIVYKLLQIQMTRPIVGLFVIGAFIVAAQNILRGVDVSAFQAYGAGRISLFELSTKVFGGSKIGT